MQIQIAPELLTDPATARTAGILRRCVHCGMCQSTCPTYVLLGDERDSPRGRIYFIKEMMEKNLAPTAQVVTHIDRCLSCLACVTTCPAGVDYHHLIDDARVVVEARYRRPWVDRALRAGLASILPNPWRFWMAVRAAKVLAPLAGVLPKRLRAMLKLAQTPVFAPPNQDQRRIYPAQGRRRMRVALLPGCVQDVLKPEINQATIRLLTRLGAEVLIPAGVGCCGALTQHLGKKPQAQDLMRKTIQAFMAEAEGHGLDAIIANASGCGTQLKDYGWAMQDDDAWAGRGEKIAGLARDVTEVVAQLGLPKASALPKPPIAYHSACSLQHGQKLHALPKQLLLKAGFPVFDVPDGHLCCGSAGSYNLLQPAIAGALRDAKLKRIEGLAVAGVAAGNIGCLMQLAPYSRLAFGHTVEWLDWATGGPAPKGFASDV